MQGVAQSAIPFSMHQPYDPLTLHESALYKLLGRAFCFIPTHPMQINFKNFAAGFRQEQQALG